ncbi:hypothetical protein [Saccharopolyspora sp. NPDC002376]
MITSLLMAAATVVALAGWWAVRHFGEFGKHAGAGEGALTVEHLLDQAKADELALTETRELPRVETASTPSRNGFTRDPEVIRQVLAGLHRT